MTEFRPGWRWKTLMAVFAMTLVVGGIGLGAFAPRDGWWMLAIAAPTFATGVVMLARVNSVSISFGADRVHVVGVLWSRTISLDSIDEVRPEPEGACIEWRTRGGGRVNTPLTAVQPGRLGWLPYAAMRRRRRFLQALDRWSR